MVNATRIKGDNNMSRHYPFLLLGCINAGMAIVIAVYAIL